jgi:hypothetical protein
VSTLSGLSRAAAAIIVASALLAGCACGGSTVATTPPAPPSAAPSSAITPSASPSATVLPTTLVGTWVGREEDHYWGEIWETTYRIQPCRQHDEPWWAPADDQQCGDWTGDATIEGLPATCTATLSWLESDGDAFMFLASHAERSAKYQTIPHPYLKIGETWVCWDTFRIRLTPGASGTFAVETIGSGSRSGSFIAMSGTVARGEP